ncbi:hypothetical protein BVRB_029700, partial [Beta vulgaris subsp. vulgaris]
YKGPYYDKVTCPLFGRSAQLPTMRGIRSTTICRLLPSCRPLISSRAIRFVTNDSSNSGAGRKLSGEDQRLRPKPAIDLIDQVPPVKVKAYVAVCDGGGGPLGHPVEYIMLDTREPNKIETCKYCGARFVHESDDHH